MRESLEDWVGSSRILALVFTDIVDSTKLGNALGDEQWIVILRQHFARARSLMSAGKCFEIKIIGDSFMVACRSVVDALDFALAFHADTGHDCVRIRAGIHVGPVRVFENDLFGKMVNYTKRVESTDNAGFIVVSNEARIHIASEKASHHKELCFSRRLLTFKGFKEPQEVWRVVYPDMSKLNIKKRIAARHLTAEPSSVGTVVKKIVFG